jgi:deoxyadenosine/deoxycytidine kinase
MSRVVWLTVHGNIGVGKTTLIERATELFAHDKRVRVVGIAEPCSAWTSSGMLQMVIQDSTAWGVPVQYGMRVTRATFIAMQEQNVVEPCAAAFGGTVVVLCERSYWDDREIFARFAITDAGQYKLYEKLCDVIPEGPLDRVHRMLYLTNDSVELCMEHIASRGRAGESGYTPEWIAELEARHKSAIACAIQDGIDVQTVPFGQDAHVNDELIRGLVVSAAKAYGTA